MDSRHRSRGEAECAGREQHPQRRLRAAVGRRRLDVRRRGRARPDLDDVAGQPAQPQAGHPSRSGVHEGRRAGGRRNEQVGAGLLRPADHRRLEEAARLHDQDLSRRAACTSTTVTCGTPAAPAFPRRSSMRRSTSSTTTGALREAGSSLVLYLPKIQTAEEAALWNDILSALEQHLGLPRRRDQGLRARRAGRSVLPADGDPRRPRQALHRLQHRPLGLHQQRLRRDGLGSRRSSTRTSTPSR